MSPVLGSDVTKIIGSQHEQVKAQLTKVADSSGDERAKAFHRLRLMLALHETGEEVSVHPQVIARANGHVGNERVEEEHEAAATFGELERLDVDSDEFASGFGDLADDVREHAEAEEEKEWPLLTQLDEQDVVAQMIRVMGSVPELVDEASAPGPESSFEQMLTWAQTKLTGSPS